MRTFTILAVLVMGISARTFNYKLHESNDDDLNKCVEDAVKKIETETCLFWEEDDMSGDHITFLQSGHCSWQASNRTVHLSPNCITDHTCFEMLGKVSDVEQPHNHISRHLNIKFNCTEKCTIDCENGGYPLDNCTCKCGFGFAGDRCQLLADRDIFTDDTCGEILTQAGSTGTFALKTYPGKYSPRTACSWLIKTNDPWDVIELTFDDFDLDNLRMPEFKHCNDDFNIYGAAEVQNPISCKGGKPGKVRSTGNWLLVEMKTNGYPAPDSSFKGPAMRYQVFNTKRGIQTFSEEQTASASFLSTLLPLTTMAVLRLL